VYIKFHENVGKTAAKTYQSMQIAIGDEMVN